MATYLIFIIFGLFLIIVSPFIVALFIGRASVCGTNSLVQCLRDWLSVMGGPLAILAALIAALPVFYQLDENRVAMRIALASIIRIEEQDIEGAMAALRTEEKEVLESRKLAFQIKDALQRSEIGNKIKSNRECFAIIPNNEVIIASASIISHELAAKIDKDTVMPHRKNISADFDRIISAIGQLKDQKDLESNNYSFYNTFPNLKVACLDVIKDIDIYDDEYHKLEAQMVISRDNLAKRRRALTDSTTISN